MNIIDRVTDLGLSQPDGMKTFKPHPELAALVRDLRDGTCGLKETAIRAWVMNDRLADEADPISLARFRCIAKRISRHIAA